MVGPTPWVLWLDYAKCLIPNFRFVAELWSDGHQGQLLDWLPVGAICWQGPGLGPFASMSLSCKEDPRKCEGKDGEALSAAEKQAFGQ